MLNILDFHIRPQSQDSYSLEIFARDSSQPLAKTTLDLGLDSHTGFTLAGLANVKNPSERLNALTAFGQRLHQTLFKPEVQQVWQSQAQQTQHPDLLVLCLRIAPEADKLEALPWEALHDGEEFIAASVRTTLTRLPLDVAPQNELPLIPRPLKMFAFVSSPLDLQDHQRLDVEREQEILLEAINDPAGQGRLRADFEDEAKLEILERSLESGYHIFHYTGHGVAPEDGGGLYLENLQHSSIFSPRCLLSLNCNRRVRKSSSRCSRVSTPNGASGSSMLKINGRVAASRRQGWAALPGGNYE